MELPEDVLTLVREYAKPVFRFVKEYNHVLKVLGKKKWTILKEGLRTDPDKVLPFLHNYVDAAQDLERKGNEELAFWSLVRCLYGDGKAYWDAREDTMFI